uniref:Uncharacterized protein n=1 Tax=Octopus bimaculoides TaxID=37653 RepID=A0A0L8G7B3_OCTBM
MEIIKPNDSCIEVELINNVKSGPKVLIPQIKLCPSDANLSFILESYQFPISLAFPITISEPQGQTFKKVALFLYEAVFSNEQLHVQMYKYVPFIIIIIII